MFQKGLFIDEPKVNLDVRRQIILSWKLSSPKMLVEYKNYKLDRTLAAPYLSAAEGRGVTVFYPVTSGNTIVYFNPENQYTTNNVIGNIIVYNASKTRCDYWNCRSGSAGSFTAAQFSGDGYFRLTVIPELESDSYCYNNTTGQIYYAGRNTEFFGKTNINN